ncbi:MAG TPA: GTPase ObgE [Anaerolineales bacterium]|nr:GTPase ObgE [Anaerolineales bacterium]
MRLCYNAAPEAIGAVFLDETRIYVEAGRGGDGAVHFRREKYVPRGGPDGGDGGRGGHVVLQVTPHLDTLADFRHQQRFVADSGRPGGSSRKTGADAADRVVLVPPGTIVRDDSTAEVLADLTEPGETFVAARGGRGGRGNARFATSRQQAPRMAERGEPGESRWLGLELRLVADIGIVGVPNAGKSTLLAALTRARPKIADYPFTTLVPNLGVAEAEGDEKPLILADIPGLIEGAHRGVGLGGAFLRHVRRTRALIHLIDGMAPDPVADYAQVNAELALYDPDLAKKTQVVAVNKIDLPEVAERWAQIEAAFRARRIRPLAVSALRRQNLDVLMREAGLAVERQPRETLPEEIPVYRPEPGPEEFAVGRHKDGSWLVTGKAIERAAAMTYWEHAEAVRRFQRLLRRLGVEDALRRAGAKAGDTVHIAEYELEWQD